MDETGGAPYVFDERKQGFEVELADYLARELGRTSQPISGDWNKLPELLQKGDIDIVLNGYEFAPHFRAQASKPYYLYRLTLVVHRDDSSIMNWEDLRKRKADGSKQRVVVLTGSAAQRYMEKKFGDEIDLVSSDDVSTAFDLVARGHQMDATVQDNPSASYYIRADRNGRLMQVGDGKAVNFYTILTRPGDRRLREDIDRGLSKAIADGTLERIYRKYGIWNGDQERLWYWKDQDWPAAAEIFEIENPAEGKPADSSVNWPDVARLLGLAAGNTLMLALLSFPIAVVAGLFIAVGRHYGPAWLRAPLTMYVEIVRGTPLLLQLFVIFYLVPQMLPAFGLTPIYAGILGLAINYSAYEAENFRAGLQAISQGQMEAALALGMAPSTAIRRIIVPQAIRIVIPPLTNDFIALFKDTSVCSVILITELTRQYNVLYNNHREFIVVFAAITAGLYLLMSYPLSLLARRLERSLRKGGADA